MDITFSISLLSDVPFVPLPDHLFLERVVNIFHIKPPFLARVLLSRVEQLGSPDREYPRQTRTSDQTPYQVVKPSLLKTPGAAFDTAVTHRALRIREVKAGTTSGVDLPGFIVDVNHHVSKLNRLDWTVVSVNFTDL
jgi:hypothetical protein